MKTITVKVSLKTGEMTFEADGYTGSSCEEATKALENALGDVVSRELKPEYYAQCEESAEVVSF